jgi:hypothetical protein
VRRAHGLSARFEKRKKAQQRVGAKSAVGACPLAFLDSQRDPVTAFEVRDGL